MRVPIVDAHPEPRSFCRALKDVAVRELQSLGHDVVVCEDDRRGPRAWLTVHASDRRQITALFEQALPGVEISLSPLRRD